MLLLIAVGCLLADRNYRIDACILWLSVVMEEQGKMCILTLETKSLPEYNGPVDFWKLSIRGS